MVKTGIHAMNQIKLRQNMLITLLLEIAKSLWLGEDDLEKVFSEVKKLISSYENKKGEH